MEVLNTAEGATRFLRAKDGSLDNILPIANQILDETKNVHLPNRHIFILDLLCDRLNDNNYFKTWKYDSGCWLLFQKVWTSLNDDTTSRNRLMKKLRFIDVLIQILKAPIEQKDQELLFNVIETTRIIMKDFYIEIDDSSSISLLTSYVTTLNHLHDSMNFSDSIINYWTDTIYKLFQIPQLNSDHRYSKKSITKLFCEFLPPVLYFIHAKQELNLTQTKSIFENLICKLLFYKESTNSLVGNIDTLLSKSAEDISLESLKYLFVLIVNNLSSKDMKLCEELFLSIIKTKKFNQMSEPLLEILSNVNKSLSTEFFSSIYEKEVKSNLNKNINWSLVIHLFNLDIELAMGNGEEILLNIPDAVDQKTIIKIGESVAEAYIKAREFIEFFKNIWLKIIHRSSIWKSGEFINIISHKIHNLSSNQLNALLKFLFEQKDVLPLITSVVKGLIFCPLIKADSVKQLILTLKKFYTERDSSFWEIRYYILCLYSEDVLVLNPKFKSFVAHSSSFPSQFYYFTIFRLIEICGDDSSFDQYQQKFIEYLKNEKSKLLRTLLMDLLNRWLVVINTFFSKDQIRDIIKLCFGNLEFKEDMQRYIGYNGDIFFEQKNLTDALIIYLAETLAEKSKDSLNYVRLIANIPIECFDKYSKKNLTNTLFEYFSGSENNDLNVAVRIALKHLLIQPSFKSHIELDFTCTLKLIETSTQSSANLSNEILQSIWTQHLIQYNVNINKTYILKSITYLQNAVDSFDSRKALKLPPEFQAALLIISTSTSNTLTDKTLKNMMQKLIEKFTKVAEDLLNEIIERDDTNFDMVFWLLKFLHLTMTENNEQTKTLTLIKKIGLKLSLSHNIQVDQLGMILFKLLISITKSSYKSAVFISSLFISLDVKTGSSFDKEMAEALTSYFNKFSADEEEFKMLYHFVLHSINVEDDYTNIASLIKIMNCLIRSLKKEFQEESIHLFIKALSTFLTKYNLISLCGHKSLLSILLTLKSCLSDMAWCFNQYALETTISLMTKISISLIDPEFTTTDDAIETYVQVTQVVSRILLFHRFKLSSRHHIIMNLFASLLKPLSLKNRSFEDDALQSSARAASAYSRLLGNLCEPSNTNTSSKEMSQSLNSASALIKKSLRKHLPILILNYIYIALKYNFKNQVNDELASGIFSIFNVLSQTELRLISSSLDIPGKTYYRALYADYKEHGKWRDQ